MMLKFALNFLVVPMTGLFLLITIAKADIVINIPVDDDEIVVRCDKKMCFKCGKPKLKPGVENPSSVDDFVCDGPDRFGNPDNGGHCLDYFSDEPFDCGACNGNCGVDGSVNPQDLYCYCRTS